MENNKVRLSGIIFESLVNGEGIRRVFFSQGCKHNCKGCFNPHTHPFDGGEVFDMDELIKGIKENPMLKGVTFSGGDCFEQAEAFSYMAKEVKKLGLTVWAYTGYIYEEIMEQLESRKGWKDFIENIDVLVDGRFEEDLKCGGLRYKGSANQRIINVPKSLETGEVIEMKF